MGRFYWYWKLGAQDNTQTLEVTDWGILTVTLEDLREGCPSDGAMSLSLWNVDIGIGNWMHDTETNVGERMMDRLGNTDTSEDLREGCASGRVMKLILWNVYIGISWKVDAQDRNKCRRENDGQK